MFTKNAHVQKKGLHFCEFCEKDERFPRVEFVDFRKIANAPRENQKIDSGLVQEDRPAPHPQLQTAFRLALGSNWSND